MSKQRKVSRAERRQQKNRRRNLQLENIYSRIKGTTTDNKERAWLPTVWETFSKEIAKDAIERQEHADNTIDNDINGLSGTKPILKPGRTDWSNFTDQMTDDAKQDIPIPTSSQQIEPDVRGTQSVLSQ